MHMLGDKAMRGLRFWSMSLVLILLRTAVQTKALTFEGDLDFQISLSKRNLSMLGEEVKK